MNTDYPMHEPIGALMFVGASTNAERPNDVGGGRRVAFMLHPSPVIKVAQLPTGLGWVRCLTVLGVLDVWCYNLTVARHHRPR